MANKKRKQNKKLNKKLIEICRSFSWKLSLPNYENRDFFASAKSEVSENKAKEISEKLSLFCKTAVIRDVNAFLAEINKGLQVADLKKKPELWAELKKYFAEHKDELLTYGKQTPAEKMAEDAQLENIKAEQDQVEALEKIN